MKPLPFFFDFASPYSYLTWKVLTQRIKELEARGLVLEPRPLMMGSLVTRYVDKGPAQIPPKRDFLFRQALRLAKLYHIELNVPSQLLFNPMLILRLGLKEISCEYQFEVIDHLFKALWVHGLSVDDPEVISSHLSTVFNSSLVEQWIQATSGTVARSGLKNHLKQAIDAGCFGVPSLVFQDEIFWGLESIDFFFKQIKGEQTYNEAQMSKFLDQVSKW